VSEWQLTLNKLPGFGFIVYVYKFDTTEWNANSQTVAGKVQKEYILQLQKLGTRNQLSSNQTTLSISIKIGTFSIRNYITWYNFSCLLSYNKFISKITLNIFTVGCTNSALGAPNKIFQPSNESWGRYTVIN
jgi:hypothetical protein